MKQLIHLLHSRDELLEELRNSPVLQNTSHIYTSEEKEIFSNFFHEFGKVFTELRKYLYRKDLHNIDLVILRHFIVHNYFYTAAQIYKILNEHRNFIETYINENHGRQICILKKHLTSKSFLIYRNIPSFFIELASRKGSKEIQEISRYIYPFNMSIIDELYSEWLDITYSGKKYLSSRREYYLEKIGTWISHIKIKRRSTGLINPVIITKILPELLPGDIIVTRGNWNATNAGIPGFWKHMSLYLGDGEIIKSVGTGIHKVSIGSSLVQNDYCAVFRTHFSDNKIQQALQFARDSIGKGYDFNFDYHSDSQMVCSELVTKAFLPSGDKEEGIHIDLQIIGGSLSYPPNTFVEKVMTEYGTEREEIQPILFIDTSERDLRSYLSEIQALHSSWKRSRWSIFQK